MGRQSVKTDVNPAVVKWARESAGLDVLSVGRRLNVSPSTIEGWEQGTKKPTLTTLEKLAHFYKRPLAIFFLPAPPHEPPLPSDFRVLPREQRRPLSQKTLLAVRKARRLQLLATELLETESGRGELLLSIKKASLSDDPEILAMRERKRLAISLEDQLSFRDSYEAFRKWREALEALNVVVYQAQMPPEELRGFSLLDHMVPTLVVSIRDSINARIFTLFHEYAHLLLDIAGICMPEEASLDDTSTQETERFCDHFAGAFLVPRETLEADRNASLVASQSYMDDSSLSEMAGRYKVSKQVMLRRLLICGKISRQQYWNKREELLTRERPQRGDSPIPEKAGKHAFRVSPPRRCLLENGRFFVSLVVEARGREDITDSDLADYLSVNLKHMDKVEALLKK